MKLERCPTAPLVEARRDGRLSEREAASLERHLATCPSCAALAEDLSRITTLLRAPPSRVSPLVRRRGQLRLLSDAALGTSPRPSSTRRSRPALLATFAAIVTTAALIIGALVRAPLPAPPLAVGAPPALVPPARTETELRPDDGARFERRAEGGLTVVTLEDGGVTFLVRPQAPGERFIVKTSDAEVEVRGTVFRVEAAATRISAVVVTEGKVLVRFRGTTTLVEADETWRPPPGPPPDGITSARAAITTVPSQPTGSPSPSSPPSATRPAEARKNAAPPSEGSAKPMDGAAKDFVDGVHMLEQGSYGAAADRLSAFAAAHPDDSSAEDASFLAILALQRAGRLAEASASAKRYLERYPHGYRRAEAERIAAGAAGASPR